MRERHLVDALAMPRQFHGTEIDVARHVFAPRPIEGSIACRVRKANDAQLDRGAFAAVWNPFVEHETPPETPTQRSVPITRPPYQKKAFSAHQCMAYSVGYALTAASASRLSISALASCKSGVPNPSVNWP